MIQQARALAALIAVISFGACGGGGGGHVSPAAAPAATPTGASGQSAARQVAIHFKITAPATSAANSRKPQFVSPATNGLLVQVYTSPQASNPTPIGTTATDVSPGSTACGGATGTRTCTIYIPVPAGTEDFVFTSYDQPPTVGTTTFPSGSNILSVGELTQTITLGGTNVLNVSLGGVIASLAVAPLATSAVPGGASSYTLAISASDSDGNVIIAGSVDPYNNPITVGVTEIGGSGFTSVTLGGSSGTGSASVSVAQSTQIATVLYTGGGTPGYGAQIAVSSQGVTTVSASFSPFFVTSTSPLYTALTSTVSFTQPSQTVTVNLAELGYLGTFAATAGSSCTGVATVSAPTAGASSSAIITEGASSGTCTITFSDGTVSVPVSVSSQFASSTITIPGISGSFTEYAIPTANGTPFDIVSGADGALWFTEATGNKIGRITTTGSFTEYAVPTSNSSPYSLVMGPDGAFWFAEYLGNKIGRIGTSGSVTDFATPTSGSNPFGIALGPDGALWFTEVSGNNIGRITSSGSITEYPVPTSGGQPVGIASSTDGALWFTEDNGNKIGRITTGGTITEYTVPTSGGEPFAIAPGPDGALWFTELVGNKIGRITTTGSITEYTLTSSASEPNLITPGPDGALWFTELGTNRIGRITTSGSITEYTIPTSSSLPYGITPGPDGALWFTEAGSSKIGRLQ